MRCLEKKPEPMKLVWLAADSFQYNPVRTILVSPLVFGVELIFCVLWCVTLPFAMINEIAGSVS